MGRDLEISVCGIEEWTTTANHPRSLWPKAEPEPRASASVQFEALEHESKYVLPSIEHEVA